MPGLEIRPFSDDDVDAAASLLAQRHDDHRETEPLLPDDVDFRAQIEGEWRAEGASGVFAARGGEPLGYLIGRPKPGASDKRTLRGMTVRKTSSPKWRRTSATTCSASRVRASS